MIHHRRYHRTITDIFTNRETSRLRIWAWQEKLRKFSMMITRYLMNLNGNLILTSKNWFPSKTMRPSHHNKGARPKRNQAPNREATTLSLPTDVVQLVRRQLCVWRTSRPQWTYSPNFWRHSKPPATNSACTKTSSAPTQTFFVQNTLFSTDSKSS